MTKYFILTPNAPQAIGTYSSLPKPARAAVGVSALPKGAGLEMETMMVLE